MAERYPAFRAGQKVTGALLASMQAQVVRKVSDTSRTTTSATADPELVFSVEANAVYVVEGVIFCNNTTPNDDLNIGFTGPAGSDGTWAGTGRDTDTGGAISGNVKTVGTSAVSTRSFGTDDGGASLPTVLLINATLITASTAGTYSLVWAQLTATGTLTLYQDSWLKYTRIA